MGKKSGPSAPPAPDPAKTAAAQAGLNKEAAETQAKLNRINEITPFGSVTYQGTGSNDAPYLRTTTLDPEEKKLLDSQRSLELALTNTGNTVMDRIGPQLATPFTLDGLPPAPVADDASRQRIEAALMERMQPQLDRQRQQARTQLSNMGFDMNSEGYRSALDEVNRAENDARLGAIAQGGSEMANLFGLGMAGRQQGIQERAIERSQPLNEIASILGTGQVSVPQFGAVPQVGVAPGDITGPTALQYQGQMNAYNQAQNSRNAMMGGLFGLGSSALGAGLAPGGFLLCSRDYKTDEREPADILPRIKALPVKAWRYKGQADHHIGPYAEDWKRLIGTGDGKTIPVVDAFGVCLLGIQALTDRVEALEHGAH